MTVTLTPSVAGSPAPTGAVVVTSGDRYGGGVSCTIELPATSCTLTEATVGVSTLYALYYGDGVYQTAEAAPVAHAVGNSLTLDLLPVTPEPSPMGQPYTVRTTVTRAPASGPAATGTITISDGGNACTATLPITSCTIDPPGEGPYALRAWYSGDAVYAATSSGNVEHVVSPPTTAPVTIAIASVTPEPTVAGQSYTVDVAFGALPQGAPQPTGTLEISDGSRGCVAILPQKSCTVPGGSATGTLSVTAHYSGDANYQPATSAAASHTVVSPGHTEICGFDPSIPNTDPPGWVPIEQMSGSVRSPGVVPSITGAGPLGITATSPGIGETTGESSVDVMGTLTGPSNTGITVNGVVGVTANGRFLVPNVPLEPGVNELTIVATTLTGATATATAWINRDVSAASPIALGADTIYGFAPATIRFELNVGNLPNGVTARSVALDFDGDGTYEFDASSLPTTFVDTTYPTSGRYTVSLKVVDSNNITYVTRRSILLQDVASQRGMLCDVFGYLRSRLLASDAPGAGLAYQPVAETRYLPLFIALGAGMPAAAPKLGVIANGTLARGYAELSLVRDNADQTRSGFPLRMTQGADGVWRISEMRQMSEDIKTPAKPRRFKLRWIVFGLLVIPFLPQVPSCVMANSAKSGRIVDVTTGQGIPDVAVIAAANHYAAGPNGNGGDNTYRVITHTDANGNYWIPSQWVHLFVTLPYGNSHHTWLISGFKPGYAFVGDDAAWTEYRDDGQPRYWPKSVGITPPATWFGLFVRVEPLEMRPVQLPLRDAALYYKSILVTGNGSGEIWNRPEEVAVRKVAYDIFMPKVCALPPDTAMNEWEVGAYETFVRNPSAYNRAIRKSERKAMDQALVNSKLAVFQARNVCIAMKLGELSP